MSVTIAIPFYNAEKYLELSIKSVFAQTYQDWELILIDDGSTDSSLEIAKSINDKRVRVISDGQNKNLAARLNQVAREAKYELIARMDADDLIPTYRLDKQVDYLNENPNFDLVTTGLCSLNNEDKVIGIRITEPSHKIRDANMLFSSDHGIVHASILMRKSWLLRNSYDETMKRAQDYELWLRAFTSNDLKIGFLPIVGYYYREEANLTKKNLLITYQISLDMLVKYSRHLSSPTHKKNIVFFKKTVVNLLAVFGCLNLLLKKRSKIEPSKYLIEEINSEINKINSIELPRN